MFNYTYTVLGITFQIESDLWLDDLELTSPSASSSSSDVHFRIQGLDLALYSTSTKLTTDRAMDHFGHSKNGRPDANSVPLDSPLIRERMNACSVHPDQCWINVNNQHMTIYDYYQRQMTLFYRNGTLDQQRHRYMGAAAIAPFLPLFSATLLHSSSVCLDGTVAVFVAADGGGKTTAATLSPDGDILCDDQNVLRWDKAGCFTVQGTPWGRYTDPAQQARLGGLFFLEKAAQFKLIPLDPLMATTILWDDHRNNYALMPDELRIHALNFLQFLTRNIPIYRLQFPQSHIDWSAVRTAMAGGIRPTERRRSMIMPSRRFSSRLKLAR